MPVSDIVAAINEPFAVLMGRHLAALALMSVVWPMNCELSKVSTFIFS